MLGFRPFGSAPLAGPSGPARTVQASKTVGGLTNVTSINAAIHVTSSMTVGGLTQFTGTGYSLSAPAQQLGALTQQTVIKVYTAARGAATVGGLKQTMTFQRASLVQSHATVGGITQTATASVFWHLPDCGWIGKMRGDALDALLRHLPEGVAWLTWRWPGKTAFKFASGIAQLFDAAIQKLCETTRELDPRTTEAMLPEWEAALSLPDKCLPEAVTSVDRRRNIWFRLDKKRWKTADDWKRLAAMFGLKIDVTPGWYVQRPALYQMCYPKRYDLFPRLGRFRVYIDVTNVTFPGYDYGAGGRGPGYPIPYGSANDNIDAFRCLIERVKPSNVVVLWNKFPTGLPCVLPPPDVPALDFSKIDDSQYIPLVA